MKITPKIPKDTDDVSRGFRSRKETLIDFLKSLSLLSIVIALITFLAIKSGESLPDSIESSLQFNYTQPTHQTYDKYPALKSSENQLKHLLQLGVTRDLNYRIRMFDSDQVNAFAMPGGDILITRGLLDRAPSDAALAFLVAHELAHHELRHVTKRLSITAIWELIDSFLNQAAVESLLSAGGSILMLPYSRLDETEADDYAAEMLIKLYGDLKGAEELFEILADANDEGNNQSEFFSTHPLTTNRINRLKQR